MSQPALSPRTRCRLPCTVRVGRKRIHARVLDVSEGGLCIVTPVRFNEESTVQVVIDVPRVGPVRVEGVVRHKRPFRQPSSGRRGWATGLRLHETAPEFRAIASPEESLPEAVYTLPLHLLDPKGPLMRGDEEPDALEVEDPGAPQVYRVRLKAMGSARTRVLTLTGRNEEAVREAILTDLPGDWEVISFELNPLD